MKVAHILLSRTLYCFLIASACLATRNIASAQQYRFQVEELDLQVYIQPDASARLQYKILFANDPSADAIDIVDIGLPHRGYKISNMTASVNGNDVQGIRTSKYIDIGVEVPLGGRPIRPGEKGEFRFECVMPNMVYQDTTDEQYASLQIKPTWFDPSLQTGSTMLRIAIHMPASIKPEEVKYQQESTRYDNVVLFGDGDQKHVVAIWEWPNHRLSSSNPKVGVSFPKRDMERVVTMSSWQLLVKWFAERPGLRVLSGFLMLLLFGVTFYRFANGTGWIVGLAGIGLLTLFMALSAGLQLFLWLPMIALFALNEWSLKRGKGKYLPAMATVEGGGIKRGLTAPQAAVLLEKPLGKVLALVVFGMLKKGLVRVVQSDPLTVEVTDRYRCPRRQRKKHAAEDGTVVHSYEQPFLDRIQAESKPVAEQDLKDSVKSLVMATVTRMKGFDLSDSREYYRLIVQRAWTEAESIGEIDQRDKVVDRNLEWMMLDPEWEGRLGNWGHRGYTYHPRWYPHAPRTSTPGGSDAATPSTSQTSAGRTSLGEVASSFAGWAENTAGGFAGAVEPVSLGLTSHAGVLDLSSVDTITADVFEALAEASKNSGGGRGGGGGCACACAGCACACACAGGGR